MKKDSISQTRIRKIVDLCHFFSVPIYFRASSFENHRYIVVACIGDIPFYYSLSSFLLVYSKGSSIRSFSKVVIDDMLY